LGIIHPSIDLAECDETGVNNGFSPPAGTSWRLRALPPIFDHRRG
jgi:hypothetical protein